MSLERLERIEAEFRHDEKAFLRRGALLKEVRDERLYKGMFERFEEYCDDRLRISRQYAYRLIEGFETASALSPIGDTDFNECQLRPLGKLEPEQRPAAWQEAVERSDGKPTGKVVLEVVKEMLGEPVEPEPWDIWDATEQLRKKIMWCAERWPRQPGAAAAAANQLIALAKQFESMMGAADAIQRGQGIGSAGGG